jgi:hypothetical protein
MLSGLQPVGQSNVRALLSSPCEHQATLQVRSPRRPRCGTISTRNLSEVAAFRQLFLWSKGVCRAALYSSLGRLVMARSIVGYLLPRARLKPGRLSSVLAALMMLLPGSPEANALTKEQALEACRQSVGKPYVQSCMRAGGDMATCRAKVHFHRTRLCDFGPEQGQWPRRCRDLDR